MPLTEEHFCFHNCTLPQMWIQKFRNGCQNFWKVKFRVNVKWALTRRGWKAEGHPAEQILRSQQILVGQYAFWAICRLFFVSRQIRFNANFAVQTFNFFFFFRRMKGQGVLGAI